ncbi:deazaflavin-dependent oxidoreductase (nitroreductase family) [Salinibacterium sp. CAN_S4]|uniref:nitroreductase family deazaflavin-dependent oxidoreductase n=1 Tax=Salinibacterium sp. CAN_S4 TaxID=2787727 RepID=UPI0018EF49EE
MSDWDRAIIEEFRGNDGVVGGPFTGARLLLLHTVGAKSGEARTSPMMYFTEAGETFVIASKAGAPENPAWYHNLVANPDVRIEQATGDGIDAYDAVATEVDRSRRDELFAIFAAANPGFAGYQAKTERIIPVIGIARKTE